MSVVYQKVRSSNFYQLWRVINSNISKSSLAAVVTGRNVLGIMYGELSESPRWSSRQIVFHLCILLLELIYISNIRVLRMQINIFWQFGHNIQYSLELSTSDSQYLQSRTRKYFNSPCTATYYASFQMLCQADTDKTTNSFGNWTFHRLGRSTTIFLWSLGGESCWTIHRLPWDGGSSFFFFCFFLSFFLFFLSSCSGWYLPDIFFWN